MHQMGLVSLVDTSRASVYCLAIVHAGMGIVCSYEVRPFTPMLAGASQMHRYTELRRDHPEPGTCPALTRKEQACTRELEEYGKLVRIRLGDVADTKTTPWTKRFTCFVQRNEKVIGFYGRLFTDADDADNIILQQRVTSLL
eukprot:768055-Hanusia_phi.AAC.1